MPAARAIRIRIDYNRIDIRHREPAAELACAELGAALPDMGLCLWETEEEVMMVTAHRWKHWVGLYSFDGFPPE